MIIVIIIIIISLMRHDKAGRSQAITNDCRLATSTNAHNVKLVSILSAGALYSTAKQNLRAMTSSATYTVNNRSSSVVQSASVTGTETGAARADVDLNPSFTAISFGCRLFFEYSSDTLVVALTLMEGT